MLSVEDLKFRYDEDIILEEISFSIADGELVALVGANGSGKTTLIKTVFNLLAPEQGRIKINGLSNLDKKSAKMMMYLESENTIPDFLTGEEYVHLMGRYFNVPICLDKVNDFLVYFDMQNNYRELIETYSHGMKKKIQLIVAFLIQPSLLVIDETLNGIDIESQEAIKDLLKQYIAKGKSVLLCTHDFSIVEELESRSLLLYQGKIQYDSKNYIDDKRSLSEIFKEIVSIKGKVYELD